MKYLFASLFFIVLINGNAQSLPALLKSIENNHTLHMKYVQTSFVCQPYGIETISELVLRTDINSSCMGYLNDFRLAHPKEKFFASMTLYVEQQYSVEGIDNRCLLHLSSGHSYSEALLEKGYARIMPGQKYRDFLLEYRFKKAKQRGKTTKVGIWSDANIRNCFLLPPKK